MFLFSPCLFVSLHCFRLTLQLQKKNSSDVLKKKNSQPGLNTTKLNFTCFSAIAGKLECLKTIVSSRKRPSLRAKHISVNKWNEFGRIGPQFNFFVCEIVIVLYVLDEKTTLWWETHTCHAPQKNFLALLFHFYLSSFIFGLWRWLTDLNNFIFPRPPLKILF